MGTIKINAQSQWDLGDRGNNSEFNFNSSGLCPVGRGNIIDFEDEKWLDMTCAQSDPTTGGNKRTEFKWQDDGSAKLVNNQFYYFELYLKDYTADSTSPNSCNHSFMQLKYGDYYPQVSTWIRHSGSSFTIDLFRQISGTPNATASDPDKRFFHFLTNVISNAKIRLLYDILWRQDNTGHIKVYIDGSQVFSVTGIQTLDAQADPSNPLTPPPRLGPYCFGGFNSITSRSLYYRNYIIGNEDFGTADNFFDWLAAQDGTPPVNITTNTIRGRRFRNF